MEKKNKLADLKLVSKHFPTSNYSYPRCDGCAQGSTGESYHHEYTGGTRPSRESSFSSVPSMVDDTGSDDEATGEDELQYHVTGAEIWDSFWPRNVDHLVPKSPRYPALIKSPANHRIS